MIWVISLFLFACEKEGDRGTLVIGMNSEPDALNPLTALSKPGRDVISLVFRRLADLNEDLSSFSPQLAKDWVFSGDSMSITFYLRSDVLWHDGVPFTAEDVVFTYAMQVNPAVAWDGISFKETIERVDAPDDSTVVFHFLKKTPTMLMDAVEGYIVPAHLLKETSPQNIREAPFNINPVGTGPFRFVEWKSQQSITLEKVDFYYEKNKPHLNRIFFKVIPNTISLWQQLVSGDIDFLEGVPPRQFTRLVNEWREGKTNIQPISYLGRQYDFIGWNLIDPDFYSSVMKESQDGNVDINRLLKPNTLFGSQKVRAALTMAIDRSTLTNVVSQGMAIRMDGPIPLIWASCNPEANNHWDYSPDRAVQQLKEEGWVDSDGDGVLDRNGKTFSFEMVTNSGNERREQALTIIQDQLKKIGVEMIPRVVDPGLLYGRMLIPRQFDAALIGWDVGLKMDLTPLFHSSSLLMPFNFTSFRSEEFDLLQEAANETFNQTTAQEHWDSIARHLSWELPYTWLYYQRENVGKHRRFKGAVIDKRGAYINLEEWWIPPEEQAESDRNTTR